MLARSTCVLGMHPQPQPQPQPANKGFTMEKFVSLMEKINNPGTFSVSGKLTSIPPGLKIKGFGTVALPFIKAQATDLIRLGEQAPFGRGEDTNRRYKRTQCLADIF